MFFISLEINASNHALSMKPSWGVGLRLKINEYATEFQ